MPAFQDSITIGQTPAAISKLLVDLERHPSFATDGLKHYRMLTRETCGPGARAAIEVNLLGHWLPAELEVRERETSRVRLTLTTEPAELDVEFLLVPRDGRTEVRLSVTTFRRDLPLHRIRTRIKQRLRLDHDVAILFGTLLSTLKATSEHLDAPPGETAAAPTGSAGRAAPAPDAPVSAAPTGSAGRAAPAPDAPVRSAPTGAAGRAAPAPDAPVRSAPTGAAGPPVSPEGPASSALEFIAVGATTDLAPGQARAVQVQGCEVALFNIGGKFYATADQCAHRGGSLAFGTLEGPIVTCPLHAWTFDVTTGRGISMPGASIPRYAVLQDGQTLKVSTTPLVT